MSMRSVLITGGAGGLGGAVTAAFEADGWRVAAPSRQEADLFDPAEAARVAALASPLRAVVNLVGGFAVGGRVHETPVEEFEQQLRVNLRPTYLVCQAALPHLMAAGGGSIVCVSSRTALHPFPGAAGYVTAKAGVLALVDALDVEYAKDGIRTNAVLPGMIDTPVNRASMPDADRTDWVQPEAIARTILFLAGDESSSISGAHIPVHRA
jgi:NAD(P)-dependent dehydrogenase (short-subunit alcohol dehydrogenase family)